MMIYKLLLSVGALRMSDDTLQEFSHLGIIVIVIIVVAVHLSLSLSHLQPGSVGSFLLLKGSCSFSWENVGSLYILKSTTPALF